MPTHVISAPTPTITQRYDDPIRKCSLFAPSARSGCGFLEQDEWELTEDTGTPELFLS
jgi:hypothetical protein